MARRKKLTAQLPPTPCTPEMRKSVVEFADNAGLSMADVMRSAISIFLYKNVGNTHNTVGSTHKETA